MARDIINLKTLTEKIGVYRTLGENCKPEDDLNIEYKIFGNGVDSNKEAGALMDEESMEALVEAGVAQTLSILTWWDLMNNGQPVPLTLEGVMEAGVPQRVFIDIGAAIAKAAKKNVGKGQRPRLLRELH